MSDAISAARTLAEALEARAKGGALEGASPSVDSLLREIDRANAGLRDLRERTYRAGDALSCRGCGYTFVNRRSMARGATCRRCGGLDLKHWRP